MSNDKTQLEAISFYDDCVSVHSEWSNAHIDFTDLKTHDELNWSALPSDYEFKLSGSLARRQYHEYLYIADDKDFVSILSKTIEDMIAVLGQNHISFDAKFINVENENYDYIDIKVTYYRPPHRNFTRALSGVVQKHTSS
jgi:hypothetical protein